MLHDGNSQTLFPSIFQENITFLDQFHPICYLWKERNKLPSTRHESVTLKLLTKEQVLKTYKDVFEGIGTFPRPPYRFKLKPNAFPAKHSPWKVPIHLQEAFHKEVYDLVDQGILELVEHSTKRVNSYVIIEKETSINCSNSHLPNYKITKKLRICLDLMIWMKH